MRCHMLVFSVRYSCRICECCNYVWRYDKVTKSRNLWCSWVCDMCTVNAKGGKKYDVDKSEEDEVTARREDENQKCSCMLIYKYTMTLWNQKMGAHSKHSNHLLYVEIIRIKAHPTQSIMKFVFFSLDEKNRFYCF